MVFFTSLYHINKFGYQEPYFKYKLTKARIIAVSPIIGGTENNYAHDKEQVAFIYEDIEWQHVEGNYAYTDSWSKRS